MRKLLFIMGTTFTSFISFAQTPCENGMAGNYPCNGIDLYAHIDNNTLANASGVEGSDIWGWTDPLNGKEYALMAQTNGTVFVDLSNPTSPKIIGRLPSHLFKASLWRDVKVYNSHAFIVADNNDGHGMQVFNLQRLRNVSTPPEVFTEDAHYDGVSSAHNIVINESKGLAYIVGARGAANNCGSGGLHIVDISTPLSPVFAGCFDVDGYTHDAQVVTYHGPDATYIGKQLSFNANENTITIADVSNPSSTRLISKQGYASSAYTHQGWLTEDHRYFISNDELDETRGLTSFTKTLIWDVTDLDFPVLINSYLSSRSTIDHNLYTHRGTVYQSNYTAGLIMLDGSEISDSGSLNEIGYFDTYPNDNSTSFNGTWSNYPFFKSGLIIISDINGGLFIVKRNDFANSILTQQPNVIYSQDGAKVKVIENSAAPITSFQWEVASGANNFTVLEENETYTGVNTANLMITFSKEGLDEQRYRCVLISEGNSFNSALSNPVKLSEMITGSINAVDAQAIKIYPNPVKEQLFIEPATGVQITGFKLYNAAGKLVKEGLGTNHAIQLSELGAGMYILVLTDSNNNSSFQKLIKE